MRVKGIDNGFQNNNLLLFFTCKLVFLEYSKSAAKLQCIYVWFASISLSLTTFFKSILQIADDFSNDFQINKNV